MKTEIIKHWNDKTQGQYNQVENSQNGSALSVASRSLQPADCRFRDIMRTCHDYEKIVEGDMKRRICAI